MTGISSGRQLTPEQRQVLAIQAERAGQFYKSAEALLPLISPDSRAAMWVLVTIYHRLLRHIEQRFVGPGRRDDDLRKDVKPDRWFRGRRIGARRCRRRRRA